MGEDVMKYPECEKVCAVQEESQAIGEFLDWLQSRGICLATWGERERTFGTQKELCAYPLPFNQLLAEYFEINLVKVEEEKQAILTNFRSTNDDA